MEKSSSELKWKRSNDNEEGYIHNGEGNKGRE